MPTKRKPRKQVTCNCAAYPWPHRFDPKGYCMDFLPPPIGEWKRERDGDWWEEAALDAKHRAADMNKER